MNLNNNKIPIVIFLLITFCIIIFYLNFLNLSFDTIILFLSSKLFYGEWIRKGIFPFFNPHIFNGIPYAFDLGMNHFHPLSLLFIFPFPFSFALWSGATCFLFLVGFYLLFLLFTHKKGFAVLLTLVLFFSGSGFFLRMNNPTILSVISHYGLFLFSLSYLKKDGWKRYLFPLISGVLLTLSGHIQFVVYGYVVGFILSIYYFKLPIKKVFLYFVLLGLLTSWYYLFSLPLVLESTRLTLRKNDIDTGPLYPLQLLQLFFPFIWGYAQNGSKWGVGLSSVILSSSVVPIIFFVLVFKKQVSKTSLIILLILFILAFGLIQIPFFRGSGQIFVLILIFLLIEIAKHARALVFFEKQKVINVFLLLSLILLLSALFFNSSLFSKGFIYLYRIIKHGEYSLFFDEATVRAIGNVISLSLAPIVLFAPFLLWNKYIQKNITITLIAFVITEGILVNYHQNNFFLTKYFYYTKSSIPSNIDTINYRIQTTAEVVPYVGFYNYIGSSLFRPPFSKEPSILTDEELTSRGELIKTFKLIPSSLSMWNNIQSIQGYNTFVPDKLARYFDDSSVDYKEVYSYILERNSLFAQSERGSHINSLETSRITLNDPRWEKLNVRYFISDRPLNNFKLIGQNSTTFFYENIKTLSIFRIESTLENKSITPFYLDPNTLRFKVDKSDIGKNLVVSINPNGFSAFKQDKHIEIVKKPFAMIVKIPSEGIIEFSYSPVQHLIEKLK